MENKLPKDWKIVKLKDIVTLSSQKHSPVKLEEIFYIGLEHIEKHTGKLNSNVGLEKITTIKNKFSKGDILYGKLRPNLNKVYLSKEEGVCSTDILVLKLSEECMGKYLHPIMFSTTFVNKMSDNTSGVNLPRVSTKFILNYEIPLPPLLTQQAIVSKIEELFSELDKGIEDLKTAQLQLKTYRQSVLKWAFEGKLTNENVKEGELPKGWDLKDLGEVFKVSSGKGIKINQLKGGDYSVYGGNGLNGYHSEYFIDEPVLIIGRVGVKCGVTHITKPKSWVSDNALIVKPIIEDFDIKFFKLRLEFENLNKLSVSTAQPVISGNSIYSVPIFLPKLEEQHRIVQELESRLSVADKMEESIAQSLQQAEALRQSILKKAFSGELV